MGSVRSLSVVGVAAVAAFATVLGPGVASARPSWVGTWAASPIAGVTSPTCPAGPGGLANQTVRNVVFASIGGSRVRVRLTNTFGTSPLIVSAASVAIDGDGANIVPGTMRTLLFKGAQQVTIPTGGEVVSDAVGLDVKQSQELAVSVYGRHLDGPATFHRLSQEHNFVSTPGNFAGDPTAKNFPTTISCWMFADGVDVVPSPRVAGSVVTLGDSITDGSASTVGANRRWPNFLAQRLNARAGTTLSVVDEGISGNRVLSNAGASGVSALARLDRDVLSQPGVRDVILLEGINDIGQSDLGTTPKVTATDLIAGYRQIIDRVHAAGLRIFGATLTPFKGASYWTPEGEQTREAVNQWIRTSGAFDGTIDFAAATASPTDPQTFDPAYDSGDHLHPRDAGYEAMAQAVNLDMLLRS
jgi:lysophospholipase L1-like esterase